MTKYVNDNGVSEMWTNTKNYISAQLLGYSQTGHTHSASDITSGLSNVATSGSYNDLSDKPTIPSKTSDLTNDSGFITSDTTKIPLAGTNALAGSIVPSSNFAYDLGSSSKNYHHIYTYSVYHGLNTGALVCCGGNGASNGANLVLYGTNRSDGFQGRFDLVAKGSTDYKLTGLPSGTLTWGSKNVAMQEDVVPRSGGNVLTGTRFNRDSNNSYVSLSGGQYYHGGLIELVGEDYNSVDGGKISLYPMKNNTGKHMSLVPNGTWTWNGTACQITSDQRYKQQITEIDDKLLDAWEDVNLVQFKYNDAVKEKSDNARLHTGYVVQQIDDACKKHNIDISKYGLYCHEEYAEETREVENDDGTKTTEVVRPANEHYSLRYTEALIVECAYLRKCIKELRNEIEELKSSK